MGRDEPFFRCSVRRQLESCTSHLKYLVRSGAELIPRKKARLARPSFHVALFPENHERSALACST